MSWSWKKFAGDVKGGIKGIRPLSNPCTNLLPTLSKEVLLFFLSKGIFNSLALRSSSSTWSSSNNCGLYLYSSISC